MRRHEAYRTRGGRWGCGRGCGVCRRAGRGKLGGVKEMSVSRRKAGGAGDRAGKAGAGKGRRRDR